jgi:hypothetical protein
MIRHFLLVGLVVVLGCCCESAPEAASEAGTKTSAADAVCPMGEADCVPADCAACPKAAECAKGADCAQTEAAAACPAECAEKPAAKPGE